MKQTIIMNDNAYVGREYVRILKQTDIDFDVIVIGKYNEIDEQEEARCGRLWRPPLLRQIIKENKILYFSSLKDENLLEFLKYAKYDIGIQGGTGILRPSIINSFRYGILNFHPGDLPFYRGCSAPEWQILEGKQVICTCHLVDERIDSGKIYAKKVLNLDYTDYHKMRSKIYPEIALFVAEVLENLDESFLNQCRKQDEEKAIYRKYIGDELIKYLNQIMRK